MLLLLTGVISVGSLATLALLISRAPEAYETEGGLRIVRPATKAKNRRVASLPVAQVLS